MANHDLRDGEVAAARQRVQVAKHRLSGGLALHAEQLDELRLLEDDLQKWHRLAEQLEQRVGAEVAAAHGLDGDERGRNRHLLQQVYPWAQSARVHPREGLAGQLDGPSRDAGGTPATAAPTAATARVHVPFSTPAHLVVWIVESSD